MTPIYRYFQDIYLGVVTTLIGMRVTIKHLFVPAVTLQYPHQKLTYPPRARTMLVNEIDTCNGCQQCARACPVDIMHIQIVKALKEEDLGTLPDGKPKRLHVVQFDVEMDKCLFCGLCVDVCPTDSIHWESPHEEVVYDRRQIVRRWSRYSSEERERLLERDAALKAAKAEAAAKAAAEKAAAEKAPTEDAPDKVKAAETTDPPPEEKSQKDKDAEAKTPEKEDGKEGE